MASAMPAESFAKRAGPWSSPPASGRPSCRSGSALRRICGSSKSVELNQPQGADRDVEADRQEQNSDAQANAAQRQDRREPVAEQDGGQVGGDNSRRRSGG